MATMKQRKQSIAAATLQPNKRKSRIYLWATPRRNAARSRRPIGIRMRYVVSILLIM